MKKIHAYILHGAGSADVERWMQDVVGAAIETRIEDANLVVFTGGADVTPTLYGEKNVFSNCDWLRDLNEQEIFNYCVGAGIPMFGICRGSQFLHVEMDGKLIQDVANHGCIHDIRDLRTNTVVHNSTSTHHQMVREAWQTYDNGHDAGFTLIATPDGPPHRSEHYAGDGYKLDIGDVNEVEAYRYERDGKHVLGIQGHPEWSSEEYSNWCAELVNDWFNTVHALLDANHLGGIQLV